MLSEHRRRQPSSANTLSAPSNATLQEMFLLFGNGLYLEGWHLRGVETAGPRLTTADVPQYLIPEFPIPPSHILAEFYGMTDVSDDSLSGSPGGTGRFFRTPLPTIKDNFGESSVSR